MNENLVREHVEVTGELLTRADDVRAQRKHTNRLTAIAAFAASLAVLVSMLVVFMVVRERNSSARDNGDRIDELTEQLREARADIEQDDQAVQAQLECQSAFDTQIRRVALEYLASIGELVVVISTTTPDTPNAENIIDNKILQLNERLADYRESIDLLESWRDDVPPTTCPL